LKDGLVTLDATNATPAAILAEWARVGGTRVVDGEKVTGAPVTLKLEGTPERQALDIVLRSAAGYIAAPRTAGGVSGASQFDRIVVMPVSVNASAARTTPLPTPQAMPVPTPMPTADAGDGSDGSQMADAVPQDDGGAEQPVSSTDFDYANPQRYFAARAAQERAAQEAAQQGATVEDAEMPRAPGGFTTGLGSPGVIPLPPQPQPGAPGAPGTAAPQNPYGLPAGAAPGSSTAPPMEPDRSKYINPYAPTPRPDSQ